MYIKVTRKAAGIASLWLILPGAIFAVLIAFFIKFIYAVIIFILWCAIFIPLGTIYFSSFKLNVNENYVSLRHGLLYKFVHRMPKRYITGCHTLCWSMKKSAKTAILIILCASGFYIVPGVTLSDAQKVTDTLILRVKE